MGVSICQTMPHIAMLYYVSLHKETVSASSSRKSLSAFIFLAVKQETKPWNSPIQYPKLLPGQ